ISSLVSASSTSVLKSTLYDNSIIQLTLNRPSVRNAFNTQLAKDLIRSCAWIKDQHSALRVLILNGEGDTFCSGADLKDRNQLNTEQWHEQHQIFEEMFESLLQLEIPTIAAIEGFAVGGGFELALNCDLIIASDKSHFQLPEVSRGTMPGGGGTQLLTRLCGRRLSAREAFEFGIVQLLTSPGEVLTQSLELARRIAANAPLSVKQIKRAINMGQGHGIDRAREIELKCYRTLVDTQDRYEGVRAYNEKRMPNWKGQ
ncbi:unnamed protein product, partial [Didymodactylos carnosus]